jgi:hypothetical protein
MCCIVRVVKYDDLFEHEDWHVGFGEVDYQIYKCCEEDIRKTYLGHRMLDDRAVSDRLIDECVRVRKRWSTNSDSFIIVRSIGDDLDYYCPISSFVPKEQKAGVKICSKKLDDLIKNQMRLENVAEDRVRTIILVGEISCYRCQSPEAKHRCSECMQDICKYFLGTKAPYGLCYLCMMFPMDSKHRPEPWRDKLDYTPCAFAGSKAR